MQEIFELMGQIDLEKGFARSLRTACPEVATVERDATRR
jgi:hypothetical protein